MSESLIQSLYLLVLAGFVGFEVISRVPPLLHTPLMSVTNAISGISLIGALVAVATSQQTVSVVLGCIAITAATINVVGGFMITDRMLRMFRPGGFTPQARGPRTQQKGVVSRASEKSASSTPGAPQATSLGTTPESVRGAESEARP